MKIEIYSFKRILRYHLRWYHKFENKLAKQVWGKNIRVRASENKKGFLCLRMKKDPMMIR